MDNRARGTVTAWNESTRTFSIQGKGAGPSTFEWNDRTQVHGTPKVGEPVKLEFTSQNGKSIATRIAVPKAKDRDKAMGKGTRQRRDPALRTN
jgi:hypothetical protein